MANASQKAVLRRTSAIPMTLAISLNTYEVTLRAGENVLGVWLGQRLHE